MGRNLLLFLILSVISFVSCHPARPYALMSYENNDKLPQFQSILVNDTTGHVFDTHIFIQKKQFSGLLFVKRIDGKNRFSIVTKTGQKLLDVSVWNDDMIVHHVMSQLNKKIILDQLKRDFMLLQIDCQSQSKLQSYEDSQFVYYRLVQCDDKKKNFHHFTYQKENMKLVEIGLGKKRKMKNWANFSDYREDFPWRITIDHHSLINLRLELYHLRLN